MLSEYSVCALPKDFKESEPPGLRDSTAARKCPVSQMCVHTCTQALAVCVYGFLHTQM